MTKNDKAWEQIFKKYDLISSILNDGFVDVTADQIREFREPRHLGKIDHSENLPPIFKDNQLSILTLSNQSYRIGKFEIFQELPAWTSPGSDITEVPSPKKFQSLNLAEITSEYQVVNAAAASKMVASFCGEEVSLTVGGRMRAGDFTFNVDVVDSGPQTIDAKSPQVEIDSGFEGRNGVYLFEVKNHQSKDFNIRQLYYPYRLWSTKVTKPVVPVFLTHSNDVFDFYRFQFEDPLNLSSCQLVDHKRFMFNHDDVSVAEIKKISKQIEINNLPNNLVNHSVPFPQADDFSRVIDLVGLVIDEPKNVDDLATQYAFDKRQSDYYGNAAEFLGLVEKYKSVDGTSYRTASAFAHKIWELEYKEKTTELVKVLLSIETIRRTFEYWMDNDQLPNKEMVTEWFGKSTDSNGLTGSTISRRSSTVLGWARWITQIVSRS